VLEDIFLISDLALDTLLFLLVFQGNLYIHLLLEEAKT
jgi:hypothetical protein